MDLLKWSYNIMPDLPGWTDAMVDDNELFMQWPRCVTTPAVNVSGTDAAYILEVGAPGLRREDLIVSVDQGLLEIRADTDSPMRDLDQFQRLEFDYNCFRRTFWLPEDVDINSIRATYGKGVLRIILPRRSTRVPEASKKIKIE